MCPVGRFQSNASATECERCPSGRYTDDDDNTPEAREECRICPAGIDCCWTYDSNDCDSNNKNQAKEEYLTPCKIGTWGGAGENCKNYCPTGRYSTSTGGVDESVCMECPAGWYCPGFKENTYGGKKPCPTGYYCPIDSFEPLSCPPGTSTEGRKEVQTVSGCKPCPAGTFRGGETGSGQSPILACDRCQAGTYAPLPGSKECLTCAKEFGCAEGGAKCSKGYGQNLCGVCADNYYESSGKCEECASSPVQTIIAVIIALGGKKGRAANPQHPIFNQTPP